MVYFNGDLVAKQLQIEMEMMNFVISWMVFISGVIIHGLIIMFMQNLLMKTEIQHRDGKKMENLFVVLREFKAMQKV